jgi:hypothetical protein
MLFDLVFRARKAPRRTKYLATKEAARAHITARLTHFNTFYDFSWHRVSIKNTRRRWGSCSKLGNLNFCYRVALLPAELADYVVVHELCHLAQFNHSKAFWALVGKTVPEYKLLRARLQTIRL